MTYSQIDPSLEQGYHDRMANTHGCVYHTLNLNYELTKYPPSRPFSINLVKPKINMATGKKRGANAWSICRSAAINLLMSFVDFF